MKKFLAMLTVVAVLCVTAIGCGDDKKPAAKDKTGSGAKTSTSKP